MTDKTDYESGARAPKPARPEDMHPEFSQDAATNKRPNDQFGLTEPTNDVDEKTRHSDGQQPSASSAEKVAGAAPALAEHSKDAYEGAPGTTDQRPRWEGPEETRPRGYLPAKDNPDEDRDAAGENLKDPERSGVSDAFKQKS
ncbi:hypothetical protein ICI42_04880 [Tianweitania sp. Rool2]|uniref:Uncharacterized protein n=1 Tax=Oryzicola mucosus TaxID=2767425 RepID=A0A8J6U6Y6_9HYPH|nr:hypothetical protein [Oryzicola mucosus]MBD0413982.1 hypothetical protein [Oryzicola mucosus]